VNWIFLIATPLLWSVEGSLLTQARFLADPPLINRWDRAEMPVPSGMTLTAWRDVPELWPADRMRYPMPTKPPLREEVYATIPESRVAVERPSPLVARKRERLEYPMARPKHVRVGKVFLNA
jgi:hypothetical protein